MKKKIWIVSDTHFGHHRMWDKGIRPYKFDEKIMKSWSNCINEEDTVIHLGDIIIAHKRAWQYYIPKLPGKKILVIGNHDHESYSWYMDHGFNFACEYFIWEIYGLWIIFSHIPLENLRGCDINVHGHLHDGTHRGSSPTDRHMLISMEKLNYQPTTLETVVNNWINR